MLPIEEVSEYLKCIECIPRDGFLFRFGDFDVFVSTLDEVFFDFDCDIEELSIAELEDTEELAKMSEVDFISEFYPYFVWLPLFLPLGVFVFLRWRVESYRE